MGQEENKLPLRGVKKLLSEQTGWDPYNDSFNPCVMAQMDLNCVYAGRKMLNGFFAYPGGSSLPQMPPVTSASVACAANTYSPITNPPQVCLYFDLSLAKYVVYDTNPIGTNDCDAAGGGCAWGDTVTYNDGTIEEIQFIGYECDSNSCTEYNNGTATYDTLAACGSSGCATGAGNIGCNDVFAFNYDNANGGCDSTNSGLPNNGAAGPPWDTTCCTYTAGCMDDRVFSNNVYMATNTDWPSNVGPVSLIGSSAVVADGNNIVQLDDDTSSPWGFPASTINTTSFGQPTCVYPVNNSISNANGCTDPTAANYLATYEADCADVPVLKTNDPYFASATPNYDCCTYDVGCMNDEACNYDPTATVDDGSCEFDTCAGCMDPIAVDYVGAYVSVPGVNMVLDCGDPVTGVPQPVFNNNNASQPFGNDACCNYQSGCMDTNSANPSNLAVADCQGNMIISGMDFVNDNSLSSPYYNWPSFLTQANGTAIGPGGVDCCDTLGCTDQLANNYNASATIDDGSCTYTGTQGCNANTPIGDNPDVDGNCLTGPNVGWPNIGGCGANNGYFYINYDPNAVGCGNPPDASDQSCCIEVPVIPPMEGCLDPNALNYDSDADGCPDMDPTSTDPSNLDGYGNLSSDNDSCCMYSTFCTDSTATNYINPSMTGQIACNDTDYGPIGIYYGSEGFTPIFGGAVHMINPIGTTPASDNDCCTYPEGCTDGQALNYDASAVVDDGSCEYIFGCIDPTMDNYSPTATHACHAQFPSTNGIPVTETTPGYTFLSQPTAPGLLNVLSLSYYTNFPPPYPQFGNECCCKYGCDDLDNPGAWNYDSQVTCNDGSCLYYTYGCNDPSAIPSSYVPGVDGCQAQDGSTMPNNPNVIALADGTNSVDGPNHCCIYVEPEWTYRCQGDYTAGTDDPANPPADGWGDCVEILPTDADYQTLVNYENQYGITLLFTSNNSQVEAAALCAQQCTGCQQIPTAGCSSCVAAAQGQPCGTYVDDFVAIEDMYDIPNAILFFDDIDDCDGSSACGLEIEGCVSSDYCEYWTQVVEVDPVNNPGVYANAGSITLPAGTGSMIGILGPTQLANGCITEINEGCPLTGSTNYDPSATIECPNPYYTAPGNTPDPRNQHFDQWTGDPLMAIPISEIDWMNNSYASTIMDECEFSCEETNNNGLTTPGQPELVIGNGGSCHTCSGSIVVGQQTMAPCIEVDSILQYTNLVSNAPFTLQWFDDGNDCDALTFCGGSLGCPDDGSGTMSLFDGVRLDAATNISPAWQTPGPEACNYDPLAAPDPFACDYSCVACLDDGDPTNATTIRPLTFVGPALNYEYDCNGSLITNAQVPAVDSNGESCCCYVEGCTDPTAPNYDPAACFDDGSCDTNIYGCTNPTSSNYNNAATVACDGNNGYPPNDYTAGGGMPCDPADIGTSNCCCSDVGFDCIDNLCTPHVGGGQPQHLTLQACKDDGCGDGRYRCCPHPCVRNTTPTVGLDSGGNLVSIKPDFEKPDKDPAGQEVSPVLGEQIGPIEPQKEEENWIFNNDPNTPDDLDCCIPDPMGPHATMEDCKRDSECGDCDQIMWKCKRNSSFDTQSHHLCVQTVQADPVCQAGDCFTSQVNCIKSGCEHRRETWRCPPIVHGPLDADKKRVDEGLMTEQPGGSTPRPCIQSGYFGWDTEAECLSNTACYKISTNDTNVIWGTCFVGETKVKMGDGTEKRIDEIEVGEEVLNDEGTKSVVKDIQKHEDVEVYGFNEEEAFVTKDHPLLVKKEGINEWKSIDPSWISPFDHGVETLTLEVGDKLLKGEEKKEYEIKSINKGWVEDITYNLVLDTVHTYYANDYVAHNAYFRNNTLSSTIKEDLVVGVGHPVGDPIDGCPCPPDGVPIHPACCKGGPTPPPSVGCPNPNMFKCPIGATWNPGATGPCGNNGSIDPVDDYCCVTINPGACIFCTEDPSNPGYCLQTGCDPNTNQPCNGNPLVHPPTAPCQGLWCQ